MSQSATEKPYLTTAELARLAAVDQDTIYDWIAPGVRIRGGKRVRLRADRIGGRYRIAHEAWERFKMDCNGGAETTDQTDRRKQQAAEADRKAREMLGLPPRK